MSGLYGDISKDDVGIKMRIIEGLVKESGLIQGLSRAKKGLHRD